MRIKSGVKFYSLFFALIFSAQANESGSQMWQEAGHGRLSWDTLITIGRSPKGGNNLYYSNYDYVKSAGVGLTDYGGGDRYFQANAMNFMANYNQAAARTDPRSPGFVANSLPQTLSRYGTAGGAEALSTLQGAQKGDPKFRYIEAGLISPNVGHYQTADNQQAFSAAYDNVKLGEAEQALFEGDRIAATNFLNDKATSFSGEGDKQSAATEYQKQGILRNKETAETFRDFFNYKGAVTGVNLNRMPTVEGLVGNCQVNATSNDDPLAVYNAIMPAQEIALYNFEPPKYNFDFCETYVHTDQSFLLQNLPVHGQLQSIQQDSLEMAQGLSEVAETLSRTDMSALELANYLNSNETWKKLGERASEWEECKKVDCLGQIKSELERIVKYPGSEKETDRALREIRQTTNAIIAGKALPAHLKSQGAASGGANLSLSGHSALSKALASAAQSSQSKARGSLKAPKAQLVAQGSSQISSADGWNSDGAYLKQGSNRSGGYTRGSDGVLRGKSGKPVLGFEAAAEANLFQIISSRYQKVFYR